MNTCKNCTHTVDGNFCSNCGLSVNLKRIDGTYILLEIRKVIQFEKGILYTIKELLTKPGVCVREFVLENRNRLIKPFVFIIVSSLIYTIVCRYLGVIGGYIEFSSDDATTNLIFNWIQSHYGYTNILIGAFMAIWIKIFFRKYDYNYFEILILLCFVLGMGMLIYSVFAIFEGVTHIRVMQTASILGMIYTTWAVGQFFNGKRIFSYWKAFASYMLGFLSFALLAQSSGTLFDWILK